MYHKLFIYGTLMQTKTQQQVFGQKIATFSKAVLKDWEKANAKEEPLIRPCAGKSVKGKIIQLSHDQLTLADNYEECPDTYQREKVTVKTDDGSFFNVWAYTKREN